MEISEAVHGRTRHALYRLAREARAGALSGSDVAHRIERLLEADWKLIEARMDEVRRRHAGALPTGTTSAAHSVVDDSGETGK
jgi:hypothetical protein